MTRFNKKQIVLTSEETNKAKKFAEDLAGIKFSMWQLRDRQLTYEKTVENLYRGKCGEVAAYNYLTEKGHVVSEPDFTIHEKASHGADLELVGKSISFHVKTCLKNFISWNFQKNAPYVLNPTSRDFNCLVRQIDFDVYEIFSIKNSSDYVYEKTLKNMPSKVCINENTL